MGQYDDKVERQRVLLQAEEWAKAVKSIHAHSLNSMWYDNRPQDTEDERSVLDIEYNNGLIERKTHDGFTVYFGEKLTGDELIQEYSKSTA